MGCHNFSVQLGIHSRAVGCRTHVDLYNPLYREVFDIQDFWALARLQVAKELRYGLGGGWGE